MFKKIDGLLIAVITDLLFISYLAIKWIDHLMMNGRELERITKFCTGGLIKRGYIHLIGTFLFLLIMTVMIFSKIGR